MMPGTIFGHTNNEHAEGEVMEQAQPMKFKVSIFTRSAILSYARSRG